MTSDKYVIKDGKVAVLYSASYGCGWASECYEDKDDRLAMCTNPLLVKAVLTKVDYEILEMLAEAEYPNRYVGGVDKLEVEWVPLGEPFRIDEYDGCEAVVLRSEEEYMVVEDES